VASKEKRGEPAAAVMDGVERKAATARTTRFRVTIVHSLSG
jgi:hypothetical protein